MREKGSEVAREVLIRRVATGLAAGCLALMGGTAVLAVVPSLQTRLGIVHGARGPIAGDHLQVPESVYATAPYTLVLFSRSSCSASQSSKTALAALAADVRREAGVPFVLAVAADRRADEIQFASQMGLDGSVVRSVDIAGSGLKFSPTLVLVDRDGRIVMIRDGALTELDRPGLVAQVLASTQRTGAE